MTSPLEEYPHVDLKITKVEFGPKERINKEILLELFDKEEKVYRACKKNLHRNVYIKTFQKGAKPGEVWRCVKVFPFRYKWMSLLTNVKFIKGDLKGYYCRMPWGISFEINPKVEILCGLPGRELNKAFEEAIQNAKI